MFALFLAALASIGAVVSSAIGSGSGGGKDVTPGRAWSGHVGLLFMTVKHLGSNYAWYVESVGAGAEPTAIDALRVAIRSAFESGKLTAIEGLQFDSGQQRGDVIYIGDADERITVTVLREQEAAPKPWRWTVKVDNVDPMRASTRSETAGTRGVAVLDALFALQPYTE